MLATWTKGDYVRAVVLCADAVDDALGQGGRLGARGHHDSAAAKTAVQEDERHGANCSGDRDGAAHDGL